MLSTFRLRYLLNKYLVFKNAGRLDVTYCKAHEYWEI